MHDLYCTSSFISDCCLWFCCVGDRDRDRDRSDRVDRSDGEWTRGEEPPPDTRGMRRGDSGEDQRGRDRRSVCLKVLIW